MTEQVTVRSGAPLINTETPTVSGKVDNRELQQLPFTFRTQNTHRFLRSRPSPKCSASASSSRFPAHPYQTEVSVDGILTTSVRRNGIGAEGINIFPSIESVEEIKVSSVNNTAEYSQVGDITTISKPGRTSCAAPASTIQRYRAERQSELLQQEPRSKPERQLELRIQPGRPGRSWPHVLLWNIREVGHYRTQSMAATVPSVAFRQGDFSSLATPIIDPATGIAFAGNRIPSGRVNTVAAELLQDYIPPPNEGTSIHRYAIQERVSNQFDVRIDQNFSAGHTVFGRLSWKKVETLAPTTYESLGPRTDERLNHTLVISDNYTFARPFSMRFASA